MRNKDFKPRKLKSGWRDIPASIIKTKELYYTKLALLQTWEQAKKPDPDEIERLIKEVRYYHNQLVNKGGCCPNET